MKRYTVLEFGGDSWAVEMSHLREVIEQIPSTPIPLAPGSIRGVINLRGDLVPVLALDFWLNLGTSETLVARRQWMAVFDYGRYYFGVLTDSVNTMNLEGELDSPPSGKSAQIEGTAKTKNGQIQVLRLAAMVRHLEEGLQFERLTSTN